MKKKRRHIDEMDKTKINGIFDDDGYEIDMDLIKKPSLCLICVNDDNPHEEIVCNLIRAGQRNEQEFECFGFEKKV